MSEMLKVNTALKSLSLSGEEEERNERKKKREKRRMNNRE